MLVGKIQSMSVILILQMRLLLLLCCYWTALVCVAILHSKQNNLLVGNKPQT